MFLLEKKKGTVIFLEHNRFLQIEPRNSTTGTGILEFLADFWSRKKEVYINRRITYGGGEAPKTSIILTGKF